MNPITCLITTLDGLEAALTTSDVLNADGSFKTIYEREELEQAPKQEGVWTGILVRIYRFQEVNFNPAFNCAVARYKEFRP